MATITVKVEGLEELRAKLNSRRADPPIGRFLDRGAIFIQSRAREHAPVDTNRLRGSITVNPTSTRQREVGTNVGYGLFVEKGTRPHFPPPAALQGWATRHGFSGPNAGFLVARAIARKGTKAQPFMDPAAKEAEGFIRSLVPVLAREIEQEFARG